MDLKIVARQPADKNDPLIDAKAARRAPQIVVERTLPHDNDRGIHMAQRFDEHVEAFVLNETSGRQHQPWITRA